MDSVEFTHWQAFAEIEPFGGVVEDIRFGTIAALTFNAQRDPKTTPLGPLDFFSWHGKKTPVVPVLEKPKDRQSMLRALFNVVLGKSENP